MESNMNIVGSKIYKKEKDIKSFYDKNGWVAIKNQITKKEIKKIQDDLNSFYKRHTGKKCNEAMIYLDKKDKKKLYYLNTISKQIISFKDIFCKFSKIIKILNNNYKDPVLEINTGNLIGLPKDNRLVLNWHQEGSALKNYDDMISVHYPLFFKSSVFNGTMSSLEKTHKLGALKCRYKKRGYNSYSDLIPNEINEIKSKADEIYYELNIGDVLYFHKDLIHKSNFNNSNNCRSVGIGRFTQSFGKGDPTERYLSSSFI